VSSRRHTAERVDPCAAVEIAQADGERLADAHAQADDTAFRDVGLDVVSGLDERDRVFEKFAA
jgi:hypothetical protein